MLHAIKKRLVQFSLGFFCLLILLITQRYHLPYLYTFINRIDGVIYDNILRWHMTSKVPQAAPVVVVDIDDESVQTEGRWPWPRDKLANLVNNLKEAGAVVVAFDIVLSEGELNYAQGLTNKLTHLLSTQTKQDQSSQTIQTLLPLLKNIEAQVDNDQLLIQTLKSNEVVLGYLFHSDEHVHKGRLPAALKNKQNEFITTAHLSTLSFSGFNGIYPAFLQAAPHAGFVSNVPDKDGVIRHGLLVAGYNHQLYSSLALITVMRYLLAETLTLKTHQVNGKDILDGLDLDGFFIPTSPTGQVLIPFWGLPGTIDYYSASDVLRHKLAPNALNGAIVIVGSTMVLLADLHQAPIAQNFPGLEMNANLVAGILAKTLTKEYVWSNFEGLLIIAMLGIACSILFPFLNAGWLITLTICMALGLIATTLALFTWQQLYIYPTILFLLISLQTISNFFYDFMLEHRQKNKIKELFGQYVPSSYVKEITEFPERYTMEGETKEMTVFFSDIRHFTTLSESLDASAVKRLLNTFFTPITEILFSYQGTIDKYVGDMVMAFWGAPLADKDHAYHAILATLTIRKQLVTINQHLSSMNLPTVNIGMGLNTDLMNVGDMGSKFRRAYTVIGDGVNLASRLEGLTKYYGVDILVSETTRANQATVIWQTVDKVVVKGRQKALLVYFPVGYLEEVSQELLTEVNNHELALTFYYQQDWQRANDLFLSLAQKAPDKKIYQLYHQRIAELSKNPPSPDWDGTFVHHEK